MSTTPTPETQAPTPSIPKIKTASDLKWHVEQAGHDRHFFTRSTMKFFGDTMANYGVRSQPVTVDTATRTGVLCFELYRRHPVKHGLQSSAFFDCHTFAQVFPKKD
jgi:hypothetical protein